MRWLATAVILALFALNLWMPETPLGRRGTEREVRTHVPAAAQWLGQPLPPVRFEDLDGRVVSPADLRGHAVLLVFERSVDW